MLEIHERIKQVEVERAYRIVGSMEKEAYFIRDNAIPHLTSLKKVWGKSVFRTDMVVLLLLLVAGAGVAFLTGTLGSLLTFVLALVSNPASLLPAVIGLLAVVVGGHFLIKYWVTRRKLRKLAGTSDEPYFHALRKNTRWYRTIFSSKPVGWSKSTQKDVLEVIEHSSEFVQKLNDQFTNPSGANESETPKG